MCAYALGRSPIRSFEPQLFCSKPTFIQNTQLAVRLGKGSAMCAYLKWSPMRSFESPTLLLPTNLHSKHTARSAPIAITTSRAALRTQQRNGKPWPKCVCPPHLSLL